MAETKKPVLTESEKARNAREAGDLSAMATYVDDAVKRREARFANAAEVVSRYDIRAQRQELINSLMESTNIPETAGRKPVDNAIPVKHNGEEPGETDKGEDPALVKIREDVKDFVLQPEEHRVKEEDQLNGETGDGGVMPDAAKEKQGLTLDPEGHEKGLKTLSDGSVIDAEGEKNTDQPKGHKPDQPTLEEIKDTPPINLDQKREEYRNVFGKPANTRWTVEYLQAQIDEKNKERQA